MKEAIVLKPFRDLTEGVDRVTGDTFSVNNERADYLESLGFIKASEIATKESTKKKITKKKEV